MNLGVWWYAGLATSALLILTPYAAYRSQVRADRRDREVWERMNRG